MTSRNPTPDPRRPGRCVAACLAAALIVAGALPAVAAPSPSPSPRANFDPLSAPLPGLYPPSRADRIDERPLWRLYHEGRHAELRVMLDALRVSNPRWKPDPLLVAAAAGRRRPAPPEATAVAKAMPVRERPGTASAPRPARRPPVAAAPAPRGRPPVRVATAPIVARVTAARPRPAPPGPGSTSSPAAEEPLGPRWKRIDALVASGRKAEADRLVRDTLRRALTPADRVATLHKAGRWLGDEAQEALAAAELTAADDMPSVLALREALVDIRLGRLGRALAARDDVRARDLAPALEDEIQHRRDAKMATAVGWLYYRHGQNEAARTSFERAIAWTPVAGEPRLGLARTLQRLGAPDAAGQAVASLPAGDPRRNEIRGAIALDEAYAAHEAKREIAALDAFRRAEKLIALDAKARAVRAWAMLNLGQVDAAERVARSLPAGSPDREAIGEAVLAMRARAAAARKEHEKTLALLRKVDEAGGLDRELRLLLAWTLYDLERHAEAGTHFAAAFDDEAGLEAAEGLLLSVARSGRADLVEARADQAIMRLARQHLASRTLFGQGRYVAARAAAPELYPDLERHGWPSLTAGAARRSRSGPAGLGQLEALRAPLVSTRFLLGGTVLGWLEVDRFLLSAGDLPASADAGSVPVARSPYAHGWRSAPADVVQPRARFAVEGANTFAAMVGTTPIGGPVPSAPIGEVAFSQGDALGDSRLRIFGEPVTDSMLSTIGLADPYSHAPWGRVVRMGAALARDHRLGPQDTIGGELSAAYLSGLNVADNDHEALTLRWRRQFEAPGLQAGFWGLDGMFETYRRNLGAFTWGHGGYWSPRMHGRLRLSVDARTKDLQPFVLHGRFGVGPGYAAVEPAPFFPSAPDGRMHPGYASCTRPPASATGRRPARRWWPTRTRATTSSSSRCGCAC